MIRNILLIVFTLLILHTNLSRAENVISWQKNHWPPFQILIGEDTGQGQFDIFIKLFQEELPQYSHNNVEMNWARFWEGAKAGKKVINSMAIPTAERDEYCYFSQAISFALPHRIVISQATYDKLGRPESLAVKDFITDSSLEGILEENRSYSIPLDQILERDTVEPNFERKAINSEQIFQMIVAGRADYTIEYPLVMEYLEKNHASTSHNPLRSVAIQELPRYVTAHIAAPKSPWGRQVIDDIDKMLDRVTNTRQYLVIQKMYTSDPRELDEIQSIYDNLFSGNRSKSVVISTVAKTVTHSLAQAVLEKAYHRIGYKVKFNNYPGNRSIETANEGQTDGDVARIKGTEKAYPNLRPVLTPIIHFQGSAFSIEETKEIKEWSDLEGLKVGIVRGIRYASIGTKGLQPYQADNVPHLFRLLEDGRINIAIAGTKQGQLEIQNNFKNSGIRSVGDLLFSAPLYHFVHKRNEHLVSQLDDVLIEMSEKGEIESIINEKYATLLNATKGDK